MRGAPHMGATPPPGGLSREHLGTRLRPDLRHLVSARLRLFHHHFRPAGASTMRFSELHAGTYSAAPSRVAARAQRMANAPTTRSVTMIRVPCPDWARFAHNCCTTTQRTANPGTLASARVDWDGAGIWSAPVAAIRPPSRTATRARAWFARQALMFARNRRRLARLAWGMCVRMAHSAISPLECACVRWQTVRLAKMTVSVSRAPVKTLNANRAAPSPLICAPGPRK
jgi:hypothetical protein